MKTAALFFMVLVCASTALAEFEIADTQRFSSDSEYRLAWGSHEGTWSFTGWGPDADTAGDPTQYDLGWYPLQDWEYAACMSDFSTEVSSITRQGLGTPPQVYGLTIYAAGRKQEVSTLSADNTSFQTTTLYEYEWYVQPAEGSTVYEVYKIKADGTAIRIQERKEADAMTGSGGYETEYSDSNYTTIVVRSNANDLFRSTIRVSP